MGQRAGEAGAVGWGRRPPSPCPATPFHWACDMRMITGGDGEGEGMAVGHVCPLSKLCVSLSPFPKRKRRRHGLVSLPCISIFPSPVYRVEGFGRMTNRTGELTLHCMAPDAGGGGDGRGKMNIYIHVDAL